MELMYYFAGVFTGLVPVGIFLFTRDEDEQSSSEQWKD